MVVKKTSDIGWVDVQGTGGPVPVVPGSIVNGS